MVIPGLLDIDNNGQPIIPIPETAPFGKPIPDKNRKKESSMVIQCILHKCLFALICGTKVLFVF